MLTLMTAVKISNLDYIWPQTFFVSCGHFFRYMFILSGRDIDLKE